MDGIERTFCMLKDHTLTDFIISLQSCTTAADTYALFSRTLDALGISESVYAMVFGSADFFIEYSNHSAAFVESYEQVGGGEADYVGLWSQSHEQPLVWSDIYTFAELPEGNKRMESMAQDNGIQHGFTLPIQTEVKGVWGSLGFSSTGIRDCEFRRDILPKMDLIMAISSVFDMKVRQFSGDQAQNIDMSGSLKPLRAEERETLKWLAEGYSIKQISDEKLYRSVESINLYIRSAKQKLKAQNRDQLIARAIILKLIP